MNILFVVSAMHGGGAERVIATLANRYVKSGDSVAILMVAGNECVYELHAEVRLVSIGDVSHGNPLTQAKRLLAMRRYFRRHDGVIVSFSTRINLFTIVAGLGLKKHIVVSERNDPHREKHPFLRNIIYGLSSGGFVFQTEEARDCFSRRIRGRSVVIPNPLRRDLPESHEGLREKKIAAVGRLEPQKNHRLLLEAFAGFCRKIPDYELHLFGQGSLERELRMRAQALDIADRVVFEGFCKEVLKEIKTYGMYVLSSDYEGISNSLLEAMALGIPCISTDCPIGGSALCIENEENGLLVPVGDAKRLQEAMERLATEEAQAERMGRKAREVRQRFSEECIASLWHAFLSGKDGTR